VDAAQLRANAAARLGRGRASANAQSVEHLIAAARKRGESAKLKPVDLEAKIASARAMLGASRSGK
jgi:hypothetical protein